MHNCTLSFLSLILLISFLVFMLVLIAHQFTFNFFMFMFLLFMFVNTFLSHNLYKSELCLSLRIEPRPYWGDKGWYCVNGEWKWMFGFVHWNDEIIWPQKEIQVLTFQMLSLLLWRWLNNVCTRISLRWPNDLIISVDEPKHSYWREVSNCVTVLKIDPAIKVNTRLR